MFRAAGAFQEEMYKALFTRALTFPVVLLDTKRSGSSSGSDLVKGDAVNGEIDLWCRSPPWGEACFYFGGWK